MDKWQAVRAKDDEKAKKDEKADKKEVNYLVGGPIVVSGRDRGHGLLEDLTGRVLDARRARIVGAQLVKAGARRVPVVLAEVLGAGLPERTVEHVDSVERPRNLTSARAGSPGLEGDQQRVIRGVQQLRGTCETMQVHGAEVALCSNGGSGALFNDLMLLGLERP